MSDTWNEVQIREVLGATKPYTVDIDKVIAALKKPKVEFAEGEVFAWNFGMLQYSHIKDNAHAYPDARKLTQTEVGKDWVRADKAMKLREAMRKVLLAYATEYPDEVEALAEEAIKAFDGAISDE